jgi:hypothetical protein
MTRDKSPKEVQKLKKQLELICHTYIRKRDSISDDKIGGNCFDCGKYTESGQFQAGHFEPSGSCGALLRYHPMNIHGQSGGCNMGYNQETVKINYTMAMIKKYGKKTVDKLIQMKYKSIKADYLFYEKMIELYKEGNEKKIINYLESLYA